MFSSTTAQKLVDAANFLTDEDGYSLFTNDQLCERINNELTTLWQWGQRCNRDAFTKVTSSFTIPSGSNSISMTASAPGGLAISDWSQARGVDIQVGGGSPIGNWKKLRLWNFTTRDRVYRLSYRFLGETLYINPPDQASQYPLRVWYLFDAPQVSSSSMSATISIPDGADEYIKQAIAAAIRVRLEDDPTPHLREQAEARSEVEATLASAKGDQGAIADVAEETYPDTY